MARRGGREGSRGVGEVRVGTSQSWQMDLSMKKAENHWSSRLSSGLYLRISRVDSSSDQLPK